MNVARRVARNTMILYVKMFVTVGMSLYAVRLLRGALGDSDVGVFNLVAVGVLVLGFLNASMAAASQRFISHAEGAGDEDAKVRIFNVSFVLHLVVALVAGILMELLGLYLFGGRFDIPPDRLVAARLVFHFMVVSAMVSIAMVPYDAVINAHENMLFYSIVGIVESVIKLGAAALIFILPGDRMVNYAVLLLLLSVVIYIAYRVYCHRKYSECRISPRRYFDRGLMRRMTLFSGWSILTSGSSTVVNQGLGMVMNVFFGNMINAAIGYANQITVQLIGFSTTMVKALNPVIAKSEGGNNRKFMLEAVFTGSKAAFYLNSFLAIPFLLEAPYVMTLWLRADLPLWTVTFFRLVLIKNVVESYSYPLNSAISACGDIRGASIWRSLVLILCLPVIILLLTMGYEPWVAYVVLIASSVVGLGILLHYCRLKCGMETGRYIRRVIGGTLAICALCALLSLIPHSVMGEGFGRLVVVVVVSVVAHAVLIYGLGLSPRERELVRATGGRVKGWFGKFKK